MAKKLDFNIVEFDAIYVFLIIFILSFIFFYYGFELDNKKQSKTDEVLKLNWWLDFWGWNKGQEKEEKKNKLTEEELRKVEDELLRILKEEQPELWADLERRTIEQIIDLIKKIEALKVPYWQQIIKYICIYLKRVRGYIYKR